MHILATTEVALGEIETAVDLGQTPADIIALSFTDSDLTALAAAWTQEAGLISGDGTSRGMPTLRLASLKRLRHPMSCDLYIDKVGRHARFALVRCLGGLDYWRYGLEQLAQALRANGGLLAALPGDDRADPRLAEFSTVPADALALLDRYCREGGVANARSALNLGANLIGCARSLARPEPVGAAVVHLGRNDADQPPSDGRPRPVALIVFYRANVMAGDTAPIDGLCAELGARGLQAIAVGVTSLKDPAAAAEVSRLIATHRPRVILNATAFSAQREGGGTVLDEGGCPVLQVVLAGCDAATWRESGRGLGPTDLAMHVVLPELDGRLMARAISFKGEAAGDPRLEFNAVRHQPEADRISFTADLASAWARLNGTPPHARKIALVLSDYPGRAGRAGYAVGLDAAASTVGIAQALVGAGYDLGGTAPTPRDVERLLTAGGGDGLSVPLGDYETWCATLPASAREALVAAWGAPQDDAAFRGGHFTFPVLRAGNLLVALQPDRGRAAMRKASYHDVTVPPRHGYVAFYLALRHACRIDAMVHLGTHGTLEWLPGKALALSAACWPEILTGPLPVLYPFIVNNPGEAVQAKRRLGAVAIGHMTPPLSAAGLHGAYAGLETLLEEYSEAQGLDPRRAALIEREIVSAAERTGLAAEVGLTRDTPVREAVQRLDAQLCDLKELAIRDQLHVFGASPAPDAHAALVANLIATSAVLGDQPPADLARRIADCGPTEITALLAGLDGRWIASGPAGAPTRGRLDVLPTGRNLTTTDPRAMPTRVASTMGERAANEVIRRHLQLHGEYPRSILMDFWASASLRTGAEDLAQALAYLGARPTWDAGSGRVSGVELLPPAKLGRPRIDVTVRISGLYRDIFEGQIDLLDLAITRIAALDEEEGCNPLAAARRRGEPLNRIFGGAYGTYGTGVAADALESRWQDRASLGERYLASATHAFGAGGTAAVREGAFARQVAGASALVHAQDDRERDVLDGDGVADFAGGFAAAAEALGNRPALYLLDTSRPEAPRARDLPAEVARIVRGRLTHPRWLAGMLEHGHRGAAEIAQSVDALYAFAATTPGIASALFDAVHDALVADAALWSALVAKNAAAAQAIRERLEDARARGLWTPRRNSVAAGPLFDGAGDAAEAAQ